MGSGIGVGVGVGVDRSGLGVDCRTISGRVIFLTPVPAPAPLLVSAAVFVFAVVFVLVAMFISFCVLAIELPREIIARQRIEFSAVTNGNAGGDAGVSQH